MRVVTATELARNFRKIFDLVELRGEELVVMRNKHEIATITPGPAKMTALEAMADLYHTLPEDASRGWLKDSRNIKGGRISEVRNPWDS